MFHDAGDEDVLVLVGKCVDIDLDGIAQVGVDQHGIGARDLHRVAHVALKCLKVVDDLHGAPAQHVRRPDNHGVADLLGDLDRLGLGGRRAIHRLAELQFLDQVLEAIAILGEIDRLGRGAENRNARSLERLGQFKRRLAAELHDQAQKLAVAALDLD